MLVLLGFVNVAANRLHRTTIRGASQNIILKYVTEAWATLYSILMPIYFHWAYIRYFHHSINQGPYGYGVDVI
jgi:hypothetical protein